MFSGRTQSKRKHCKKALRLHGEIHFGGNMQDLVNRLQSAEDLTRQLLVRL